MKEIRNALKETEAIISEASISEKYHLKAFELIFPVIANFQKQPEQNDLGVEAKLLQNGESRDNSDWKTQLSAKLDIPVSVVEDSFSLDDENIELNIATKQLPTSKRGATVNIALLVAAAQAIASPEAPETKLDQIRAIADNYGCYDSTNFSKHIKSIDALIKTKGKGQKTSFTLKQTGWEKAAEIAQGLCG